LSLRISSGISRNIFGCLFNFVASSDLRDFLSLGIKNQYRISIAKKKHFVIRKNLRLNQANVCLGAMWADLVELGFDASL
jgi:hypothetical protein